MRETTGAMPARLLMLTGKLKGRSIALPPDGKAILGRSQRANITIPDVNLSRSHCAVEATPQGYVLADMDSTNGTYHNGKRVRQAVLRSGDKIAIGDTEMEFQVRENLDDKETKTGLEAVSAGSVLSDEDMGAATMAMPTARKPAAAGKAVQRLKRVRFCDICDVTIPKASLDDGAAREIAGRMLCQECMVRAEKMNLDAVADISRALDQLREEVRRDRR